MTATNWAAQTVSAASERLRKTYGSGWDLLSADAQHALTWRDVIDVRAIRSSTQQELLELGAAVDELYLG